MSFVLPRSSSFIRNARKIGKKQPELAKNMKEGSPIAVGCCHFLNYSRAVFKTS